MYSHYLDGAKAGLSPRVSAHGLGIIALMGLLLAGCERESRNFFSGGPKGNPPTEGASPLVSQEGFVKGPQSPMEYNAYALSEGKRLYSSFNCVGCHANGGGDIGPALMDAKWIYGSSSVDVLTSILDGRPNGMPAFRGRITVVQAHQLAAYVRSLSGQADANAATSRDDHMKTNPPENGMQRESPAPDRRPKL